MVVILSVRKARALQFQMKDPGQATAILVVLMVQARLLVEPLEDYQVLSDPDYPQF